MIFFLPLLKLENHQFSQLKHKYCNKNSSFAVLSINVCNIFKIKILTFYSRWQILSGVFFWVEKGRKRVDI